MRRIATTFIAGLILASCVPQPVPVPTSTPIPTAAAPTHAPEIRFALIGEPQDINVWQLFDESGASYANYAVRSEYWPRLYHLIPPVFDFQPLAAEGNPSAVVQDGNGYSATVKLHADLKWTDGKPFSAEDVAFTINTALSYELGYDWSSYYSKDYLDHVEVIDPITVKFYFKQKPNVKIWQYGALQGPLVQKEFWETRVSEASALLPTEQIDVDIESAKAYLVTVQARVDDIAAQVNQLLLEGKEDRQLTGELTKRQGELGFATNELNKLLAQRAADIDAAQQAIFAVNHIGEPTLGTWIPADRKNGAWVNEANPDFPFAQPHFDRAIYKIYADADAAYDAFKNGEVDVILGATSIEEQVPSAEASPTSSKRFLLFNPANSVLQDINLRKALACISSIEQMDILPGDYVLDDAWKNKDVFLPCDKLSRDQRIEKAKEFLKSGGYGWQQEPDAVQAGLGMTLPDGTEFPRIVLLSLNSDVDKNRANAANYIEQQALHLGIPIDVQSTDLASLQYAAYSSKKYDMAILGWRLSEYPGYLCEWFGVGGQFENTGSRLPSMCEAFKVESDLETARNQVFEIQSVLAEELPFIPLYSGATGDFFQNIRYPFENVTGGLSALYGAPSYAIPAK